MGTMIRGQSDPFSEHVSIMKALYQEYQRRDEPENIAFIKAMLQEAVNTCKSQEDAVKGIIKTLSERIAEAEVLAEYPEPEGFHQQRMATLQGEVQRVVDAKNQAQARSLSLEEERKACTDRAKESRAQRSAMEKSIAREEPLLRNQLALFANISKVTWRLDQESRIAGTVSDSVTGDIRPFDMDPSALSEYERVNKMWELL